MDEHYRSTCYKVFIDDQIFDLYIGQLNTDFQAYLSASNIDTWAIITAWNPYSKLKTDQENQSAQDQLMASLIDFTYYQAVGIPDASQKWSPEESLFVLNISKAIAVALGQQFEQNALVFGQADAAPELVYCMEDMA